MKHWLWLGLLVIGCDAVAPPDEAGEDRPRGEVPYAPRATPANLGIAGYAKVLCSAVFVSGRKLDDARSVSGYFLVPEEDFESITDVTVAKPSPIDAFTLSARNAILASNPTVPLPPEYPDDRAFFTVTFFFNENPGAP